MGRKFHSQGRSLFILPAPKAGREHKPLSLLTMEPAPAPPASPGSKKNNKQKKLLVFWTGLPIVAGRLFLLLRIRGVPSPRTLSCPHHKNNKLTNILTNYLSQSSSSIRFSSFCTSWLSFLILPKMISGALPDFIKSSTVSCALDVACICSYKAFLEAVAIL